MNLINVADAAGKVAVGTVVAKELSGKLKPKFGAKGIISTIICILMFLCAIVALVFGVISEDFDLFIIGVLWLLAMPYVLWINPYLQRSKNYYIDFPNENSLEGFRLFYKGKQVDVKCKIAQDGKIAYANDSSKLRCVSYTDGSHMRNITKYRITNYFTRWLHDNNLLSDEVTVTFEEL